MGSVLFLATKRAKVYNYARYFNEEYETLMEKSYTDTDNRRFLMQKAEKILMDTQGVVPIYFFVSTNLVHDYVKGYEKNIMDHHLTRYMEIEKN